MNIMFFITPKKDVISVSDKDNINTVLKTLNEHKFSSVPIFNAEGNYLWTIKEGDILCYLYQKSSFNERLIETTNIMDVPRRSTNVTA